MKYKPYPSYKDSGVEWLGKIPEEWAVMPLKHVCAYLNRGATPSYVEESPVRVVNQATFSSGIFQLDKARYHDPNDDSYQRARLVYGDILLASTGGGVLGKTCQFSEKDGIFFADTHVTILRFDRDAMARIAYYLLACNYNLLNGILARGSTNQIEIERETLQAMPFPVAPSKVQRSIAAFLDRETARIDGLIKEYEDLIALLAEKRQALISHAVTRGLSELLSPDDPEFGKWARPVKFKDSGIEWLGEIPEGWEACKLKYICSARSGDFIDAESIEATGDYPVLGGNGLRGYTNKYNIEGLFPLIGRQGALCGNINIGNGRFWATEHAIVVQPINLVDAVWLAFVLESMHLNQYSTSAAQPGLSVEVIKNKKIPLPGIEEQRGIRRFIERADKENRNLISATQQAISLLKEHRSALISNAVTGKINVEGLV